MSAVSSSASLRSRPPSSRAVTSATTRLPRSIARRKTLLGWAWEVVDVLSWGRTVSVYAARIRALRATASTSSRPTRCTGNVLYYGNNLDVPRRHVSDESVDLVYLDPPFKSNQDYNVLFAGHRTRSAAQIKAFEDTWRWDAAA